jgi:hypothetical protein
MYNYEPGGVSEDKENPKYVQAQKDGKDPMEFILLGILAGESRVLAHGAGKYGRRNWRKDPIKLSTYQGAILRHLTAFFEGEDMDPDSGESHLQHIRACCAVMLDAMEHGTAIDDRDLAESKG